jgi:hypothetical protein
VIVEGRIELVGQIGPLKSALSAGWRLTTIVLEDPSSDCRLELPAIQARVETVPNDRYPFAAPAVRLTLTQGDPQ